MDKLSGRALSASSDDSSAFLVALPLVPSVVALTALSERVVAVPLFRFSGRLAEVLFFRLVEPTSSVDLSSGLFALKQKHF